MGIKFKHIMLFLALVVAGCAAYFSVWGLSQLFAGAGTAVIIMASGLELAKVATTTALHRYWKKLTKGLKLYLTLSVGILMIITSAGIYGFLSNAYQKTANKLEIHEGELSILDGKKMLFEKSIKDNEKIIDTKNKRLSQLGELRTTQENRLDLAQNNRNRNGARGDINLATSEIQKLSSEIDVLNTKNSILSDSVGVYNTKALELKAGSDIAGEVGPLKYISELTGTPMASVVNYLILLLIFVFDPLAIALVLMTNRIFELEGGKNPLEPENDSTKEVLTAAVEVLTNEGANEGATEGVTEGVTEGLIELPEELLSVPEDIWYPVEEPILEDEQHDDDDAVIDAVNDVVNDAVNDALIEEIEPIQETITVSDREIEVPKKDKGIQYEDIKEIKENRGFSVKIPKTNNSIERIGSQKIVKNGDNNTVYYKR
jgi:hypothetical protein